MRNIAVVLAGGRGARMKQKLNKVLLKVCGKPLILHIIDVLKQKNLEIYVVVGVNSEIPSVLGESVKYVSSKTGMTDKNEVDYLIKAASGLQARVYEALRHQDLSHIFISFKDIYE